MSAPSDPSVPAAAADPSPARQVRLPVFSSLVGYKASWATSDLLAALTLLVIAVPEQLATSRLAGMPPITGYFAFIAGMALFAFLGSNRQMSVGADSTIAPLFAVGIAHLAAADSPHYIALVGILAVMVGIIVALIGLLRMGWISEFFSAPIISGYMAGVSIIIIVHQLPDFFGLPSVSGTTFHRVTTVISHLGSTNGWTVGIGAAVLVVVVAAEKINKKLPGALVGLLGSTIAVGVLGLEAHGVSVLGTVAHGAPHIGLTGLSWSAIGSLAPIAGVVALVVVSQTAATTHAFDEDDSYEINVNRDFLGVGAGSIMAGLVGAFPVNASPARTAAVNTAGGRTQATGLVAAAALVLLIPAASLLKDVPLATLAAVLIFVASRMFHLKDLRAIARFDKFEFGLAVITLLTVALVGVEQGIGVAVGLAIVDRARLTAQPKIHLMGRLPGTTSWVPVATNHHAVEVPGVSVVLFATPLWYANAAHFRTQMKTSLTSPTENPKLLVLDTIGMSDLDFTGSKAFGQILDDLDRFHVAFAIARSGQRERENMRRSGLLARIGEDHLFSTVDEAVRTLGPEGPSNS